MSFLNVHQTLHRCYEEGEELESEPEWEPESAIESEPDSDSEEEDPPFGLNADDEGRTTFSCAARGRGRRSSTARRSANHETKPEAARLTRSRGATRAPARRRSRRIRTASGSADEEAWKTEEDPDSAPACSRFQPRRKPGAQLDTSLSYSPKDLFMLFFPRETVLTICRNTNKNAAKNKSAGEKYQWTDVDVEDLYKFFGLLMYMELVSMPSLQDYWRRNHILSVSFPPKVMSRDRFKSIFWNVHLSDPGEDEKNDRKKGSPGYDSLFRLRPLYDTIRTACQAYFHPRRELSVDERMVATKARTGVTQHVKNKPTKWGVKLFVLVDSSCGYTVNFQIYSGKRETGSEHGLPYDVVVGLLQESCLGTGYHIYMDHFYTSPKLFSDLVAMRFGACGTYRENRQGCPRGRANALSRRSKRGAVRWIREGPLLFVKWMDTREVSVCSTIHPAFSGNTVQRRVKAEDGQWVTMDVPCPAPIVAYSKHMGGVDLSDQLIRCYSTHHKAGRWSMAVLLHLLDIATTNAYVLHRELCSVKEVTPKTHKDFIVDLVRELCNADAADVSQSRQTDHIPVAIFRGAPGEISANKSRLRCKCCLLQEQKRRDTPWKCEACDVPLCLIPDRNCFAKWHK